MTFEMALQDARYDGRSEGIAIGIAEGERKNALANARTLKKLGVSAEIIAQATGLSLEEIAAL